jgi:wyosine [tRNA(Phe)-imidazoG37] synthetase (radical SAM superfamily)
MAYKTIFGPIQSRRFGLSLGIDVSPDEKSCNFDCLYCELAVAQVTQKIKNPPKVALILSEVKEALVEFPDVDVITITANGEPTLYPDLEELIDGLNALKGDKKLLILSNASTIYHDSIQQALKKIDIVKLSLDCATSSCFKKIDRADSSIMIEDIVAGMKQFSSFYAGELVVEVLVVKGVNDTVEQMQKLYTVLEEIQPDRVDIGTIDRPPAYAVEGVSEERLKVLAAVFETLPLHLIYKKEPTKRVDFSKEEIIETIKRRPQSEADVDFLFSKMAQERLELLVDEGKIIMIDIAGVKFYTSVEIKQKRKK